ncbi:MAG: hypothetical protein K2H55_03540, partial [Helicobacter sp.]|nr:hypothetical protein [Helicobacter sp.]
MNPHSCSIVIASVSEASDRVRIAFAMLSASETSLAFGIAYDSGYCRCERPLGRAAINEYRIPMIPASHTVGCRARPVVLAMMFLWVIASVSVAINEHRIPPTKKQKNPH